MEKLVEQIANLIDEEGDYDSWKPVTRRNWQDEVLRQVRNELDAREEIDHMLGLTSGD